MTFLSTRSRLSRILVLGALLALSLFAPTQTSAAGRCGTDLYQGRRTGCFLVNIGGSTVPESGWDCGGGQQCFLFGRAFPTSGTDCNGRLTWRLVNSNNEVVSRAGQASLLNVCVNGFPSAESVTESPTTGYTFEVSWAELSPFRQRIAGATVFYQANPPDISAGDGDFRACNWYGIAGWAHDDYCPSTLGGCMNNFAVTCNDLATRFWTPETGAIPAEDYDPLPGYAFCDQIPKGNQRTACEQCLLSGGGTEDEAGYSPKDTLYTAVGCIRISKTGLAGDLIRLGLGIGGGLALISILAAAFMFSTSQGDSGKLKEAKELMTASVAGLFFMIFSAIILNFLGVEILRIPGLG